MCNTAKFPDWFNSQNQVVLIGQDNVIDMSVPTQFLQQDLNQRAYRHDTYLTFLWKNPQAYTIRDSV